MKCKDDDTCDQPATQGELERVYNNLLGFSMVSMACILYTIGYTFAKGG